MLFVRCAWAKQRHSMPLFEISLKVRVPKTLTQNEANCKTFLVKISFISMRIRFDTEAGGNSVMVYGDG